MKSYDELKSEMEAIQQQMVEAMKNELLTIIKKNLMDLFRHLKKEVNRNVKI